jgi:DNA-binding MarR family transcriptional regulator
MPRHPRPLLTDAEEGAWFGFLRFHSLITRTLDAMLVSAHGTPLVEYEVLLKLSIAGGQMRMSDLADAALLSRSGLTRVVDELEALGFVTREPDESDGRVAIATLTKAGRRCFRRARETHLANVRRLYLEPLGPERVAELAEVWRDVIAGLPEDRIRHRVSSRPRRAATGPTSGA